MFEAFEKIVAQRHEYAREWKARTGKRVLGYFCCYLPEELVYAAGVLPVRILGSLEPGCLADLHMPNYFCPFSRDCLEEGLGGRYDYLDGVSMADTCRQIAQAYESWFQHIPSSFHYFVPMPGIDVSPKLEPILVQELGHFRESLAMWTGRPVTPDDLRCSIEVYNTNRRLLKRLYETRLSDRPLLSGAEALTVVLSSMLSDKAEHNQLLEGLLERLPQRQDLPPAGVRLMLVGGENHNVELLRLIEGQGSNIVVDDLCMGSRYFWSEVPPGEDPLAAIASAYFHKVTCPVKDTAPTGKRPRYEHIAKLARDYRVQGAFLVYQKFCDPQELDIPSLRQFFAGMGIPTAVLELDTILPKGQIATRAQAFIEMLQVGVA